MEMSELNQGAPVTTPVPPEHASGIAHERSSNMRTAKLCGGIVAVGAVAVYAINTLVPPSEGMDMSDRLAAGLGFSCGVSSEFEPHLNAADFNCAERRTGTLALVNVEGLGASPTDVQITRAELSQVGTNVTEMLFAMSDGNINLKPKV